MLKERYGEVTQYRLLTFRVLKYDFGEMKYESALLRKSSLINSVSQLYKYRANNIKTYVKN